jgi:hypothetical protein
MFRDLEPVIPPQGRAKLASLRQCSPFPRRLNRLYHSLHYVSSVFFFTHLSIRISNNLAKFKLYIITGEPVHIMERTLRKALENVDEAEDQSSHLSERSEFDSTRSESYILFGL